MPNNPQAAQDLRNEMNDRYAQGGAIPPTRRAREIQASLRNSFPDLFDEPVSKPSRPAVKRSEPDERLPYNDR